VLFSISFIFNLFVSIQDSGGGGNILSLNSGSLLPLLFYSILPLLNSLHVVVVLSGATSEHLRRLDLCGVRWQVLFNIFLVA